MQRKLGAVAVFFFAALFSPTPAAAQTPLFSDNDEILIVIEGPINNLVRTAARSTDPHPAALSLLGAGEPQRFEIELSARGLTRRTGGICNFPPLRLDFDGDAVGGTLMRGQNRLKMVTNCRGGDSYVQITVLEYTAYRLFNVITPMSFRVRPARVTYRDSGGRRREETQFNFLIEDVDDLARRNRLVALEVLSNEVRSSQLDPDAAARVGLFQYMIGNLDWDMVAGPEGDECCHNGKLMAASAASRTSVVPVPYDFDYSGFVDAPYAVPPVGLGVRNVRTRRYRGLCRHNEQLRGVIEHFRARRDALYAVIDAQSRLSESRRESARRYIEDFFEVLDDPERIAQQLVQRCRG